MCLYPPFLSTRPSDRNQILHTYSDRYGTHSHLNKLAPRMARKAGLIGNNLRNWTLAARGRDDLGPTAWNCHLHPSLRFSGSCNHLIHAFWQSPHWGIWVLQNDCICVRNTASHVCFCFGCQCRPLQTHQQDNSFMAVAPSGEYQSLLYLSLPRDKHVACTTIPTLVSEFTKTIVVRNRQFPY